jgi:hypothetical protein
VDKAVEDLVDRKNLDRSLPWPGIHEPIPASLSRLGEGEVLRTEVSAMSDAEYIKSLSEFLPELKEGNEKRIALAEKYAKLDAPILGKDEAELRKLYEVLYLNICTDELLKRCSDGSTAQQRWNMVEPFTW